MDFDSCVNCDAALIAASTICPQCGWPKDKPIESVKEESEEIEVSTEGPTEIKNRLLRPTGVRLISVFYMVFGISAIVFAIIFGLAVVLLVMSGAMSGLMGIGGGMGNMPMLPGMGPIDPAMMPYIEKIIDVHSPVWQFNTFKIVVLTNGTVDVNMTVIMEIIMEALLIAVGEIGLGLFSFVVGRSLFNGKKWARLATIVSAIISVPLVALFVTIDTLVLLGMVAFNGMILYYMFKSKAREYFNQTPTKKSKTKTSPTIKVKSTKVKQTVESESPQGKSITKLKSTQVRPTGVTILAALEVLSGIIVIGFAAFAGVILGSMGIVEGASTMFSTGGILMWVITGFATALGVGSFVMAWGLLKGKSWAWTWTLIFTIIHLIFDLPSTNIVGIIVDLVILYYLFRPHVKDFFGKSEQQL